MPIEALVSYFNDAYLNSHIVWLGVTLITYALARKVYVMASHSPLFHPILVSALLIISLLIAFDVSQEQYQKAALPVAFLLGPATIALAIPLYKQLTTLIRMGWRVVLPVLFGGVLAPTLAWLSIYFFNTPINLQMTMLVKSITTPLAMGTAEAIGGIASLAAVFVIITGIVGAIFAPLVFRLSQTDCEMAQGVVLGTIAHAVGTSKAISISETCAAFATLSVCLNGIVTAILLPLLFA
uniref:LrgB family protein n=1 Tax=Ningiella ruwaisensis TaxID=2364274 RepID=UPI0010A09D3F|nr:LrgB family protein [Ningiella ruwaisensis]